MRAIDAFFRFALGAIFLFSGYVKAVDPYGMFFKINDYLTAYDMQFLQPLALLAAIVIIAIEVLLGFFFIFNLYPKFSTSLMLLVEGSFTILTFISWQTNAVSDCGCFGDFVKLSNLDTFLKNVVMMIPVLWLFIRRKKLNTWFTGFFQVVMATVFLALTLGFQHYNFKHLPIHDFRPYHVGADIKKQMELPEGAKEDVYKTLLYYEKDGVVKEFTEENYPWQDSTWVWKDTKTELIQEGDKAPIHDFSIMNSDGDDLLPFILDSPSYKIIMVNYTILNADINGLKAFKPLHEWCSNNQVDCYFLSASTEDQIKQVQEKAGTNYLYYATDETTLKTIVRANPGFLLLKGSVIKAKWSYIDMPTVEELQAMLTEE